MRPPRQRTTTHVNLSLEDRSVLCTHHSYYARAFIASLHCCIHICSLPPSPPSPSLPLPLLYLLPLSPSLPLLYLLSLSSLSSISSPSLPLLPQVPASYVALQRIISEEVKNCQAKDIPPVLNQKEFAALAERIPNNDIVDSTRDLVDPEELSVGTLIAFALYG